MLNHDILNVIESAKAILPKLIQQHCCGWFDGGCFSLVSAIHSQFPDTTVIYHISRKSDVLDHAVIYLPSSKLFLDADGLQTRAELFTKMRSV